MCLACMCEKGYTWMASLHSAFLFSFQLLNLEKTQDKYMGTVAKGALLDCEFINDFSPRTGKMNTQVNQNKWTSTLGQ